MAYPAKTNHASILQTAMDLLSQHGLHGISIRSVAAALNLAPNALYRYFADREALESAVAAEVAARLHIVLIKACKAKSPEASIRSLAAAYLLFAKKQHLLYEALLVPRPTSGDAAVAPEQLWLFVVEQVSRVSGDRAKQQAAVALWAMLHGMAALQSVNAFNAEKPRSSLEFALTAWMQAAHAAKRAHRPASRTAQRNSA
jgi:AcrR family transcriptional regulator